MIARRTGRGRRWLRWGMVLVGAWAGAAAWLWATAWNRLPGLQPDAIPPGLGLILGPEEYGHVIGTHARPYSYELAWAGEGPSKPGSVLVFGAEHTKSRDEPQLRTIDGEWDRFSPSFALVESDLGILFPAFMDPVETFGEPGHVHALARGHGVPTRTWEPSDARVVAGALAQGHSPRRVALRWILGPAFSNRRHGRPADPDALVRDTLTERAGVEGIRGVMSSMGELERAWREEFPDGPDWRDVSDQHGLPGFLGRIDLGRVRDEHLVACVAELAGRGERVFVVCGSSHAVKIEPALRAIFDRP